MKLLPLPIRYLFALWLAFAGERFYEAAFIDIPETEHGVKLSYILTGILYDLFLALVILGIFSVIQVPVMLLLKKRITWLFHFLAVFALLINIALIEYFFVAKIPLDESLFYFAPSEIQMIAGAGDRFSFGLIIMLTGVIVLYFGLGYLFGRMREVKRSLPGYVIAIAALLLSGFLVYRNEEKPFTTYLINNKLSYFATESIVWYGQDVDNNLVKPEDFAKLDPAFLSSGTVKGSYPLVHDLPDSSVLAPYFNKTSDQKPPNIVIVIVESLSSDLVGEYANETGHLMPFLDSLSEKSLYFPNLLSTCQRTYNVLPAVNASVPNAPNGKLLQMMAYPDHWSLQSMLKDSYYSRFYCGVDLSFHNMLGYMNNIRTDYTVSHWNHPPALIDGKSNPWGYPDEDIYMQALDDLESQRTNGKSILDVFLTISTHDPYIYPHSERYKKFVLEQIKQLPETSSTREFYTKNALNVGAFSYADDALKAFFRKASTRQDFKNTIFLITGDHGNEFCWFNGLSRFKVPLLVYSPLLKKGEVFKSISTHLDIAPSLVNYLRTEYLPELPKQVPFIGKELDLRKGFHTDRMLPFAVTQFSNDYLFRKGYVLLNGVVYKIDDRLNLSAVPDKRKAKYFVEQLRLYNLFSRYTLEQNHVVRDMNQRLSDLESRKNIWKRFSPRMTPEVLKSNVSLVESISFPVNEKQMVIQIDAESWFATEEDINLFPNVNVSFVNPGTDREVVGYFPMRPECEHFRKNSWNKISYTLVLDHSTLERLKPGNEFACYVANGNKKMLKLRNVTTTIYKK